MLIEKQSADQGIAEEAVGGQFQSKWDRINEENLNLKKGFAGSRSIDRQVNRHPSTTKEKAGLSWKRYVGHVKWRLI